MHDVERHARGFDFAALGTIDETARQKHEQFDIMWIVELGKALLVLVRKAGAINLQARLDVSKPFDLLMGQLRMVARNCEESSGHPRKPGWRRIVIALKEKSKTILIRVEFD
jgi:hypothetical protein